MALPNVRRHIRLLPGYKIYKIWCQITHRIDAKLQIHFDAASETCGHVPPKPEELVFCRGADTLSAAFGSDSCLNGKEKHHNQDLDREAIDIWAAIQKRTWPNGHS